MFDEKLTAQTERLQAEFSQTLYRRYALERDLEKLDEDLARMEAALAQLDRVKKDWQAQKAIDEAQSKETDSDG